jgi:hypothetical protein
VFLMPETEIAGATPRLAAVAVAPGLDAATILAQLRGRVDAAFLPRPLHVVEAMPRNELGKLPRSEILRLVGLSVSDDLSEAIPPPPAGQDQQAELPILLRFPVNHPAGPGHFPGNPIIPGAVLLDELVQALSPGDWAGEIESAKFHHPVRPGESVAVTHRTGGSSIHFECRLVETRQLVLSGVLRTAFPSR